MNKNFKINDLVRSKLTKNNYKIIGFNTGKIYIPECIVFTKCIESDKEYMILDIDLELWEEFITEDEMMIE